ncbi:hypothetical protein VC74_gp59 [Mycobacterium phage Sparky]|uniref:Uncharacterized protein n=1 Tax=Mycobacterium phage Sparky TaxID=1527493 RepID=A0A076G7W4_9CAUD|nr:hypothetical protein VC74_gp59 [Mycobacterium phage Sparky]AII28211.1 hypothetical protein PBI_SPARKY_67 [Mycobacterium phage Sparky]
MVPCPPPFAPIRLGASTATRTTETTTRTGDEMTYTADDYRKAADVFASLYGSCHPGLAGARLRAARLECESDEQAQFDRMLESHKYSPDGSIWAPETLQQVRDRLEFIDAHECDCDESPHSNALHDLANDDVPVLLKVIEGQAAEIDRLRRGAKTLGEIVENQCRMALDASGLHHLINDDGDGDWGLVWERLAELGAEVERLRSAIDRVRKLAGNPETYSGTGIVTVKPQRILNALAVSDE